MRHLQTSIKVIITNGEDFGYVAACFDLPVVTQGKDLNEVITNLHEALELHLEGENMAELGYIDNPSILVTYELESLYAKAEAISR